MNIEAVLDHIALRHPEVALQLAQAIAGAAQAELAEVSNPNPEVAQAQDDVTVTTSLVAKYTPAPVIEAPVDVTA